MASILGHFTLGQALLIRVDDLAAEAVQQLLREHLKGMAAHSPPDSVHALDLTGLRADDVTFWTGWRGEMLLGCGALKALNDTHAEIKSTPTASGHLRQGVVAQMLTHIIQHARERGYCRLSLETCLSPPFAPALVLYARFGFVECAPFAEYRGEPFSLYRTLR